MNELGLDSRQKSERVKSILILVITRPVLADNAGLEEYRPIEF